jgi:hypothetical protein
MFLNHRKQLDHEFGNLSCVSESFMNRTSNFHEIQDYWTILEFIYILYTKIIIFVTKSQGLEN